MVKEAWRDERISELVDGELDDAARRALDADLAADPALRDELAQVRHVRELLRAHGPAQAPDDFLAKVLAATENEPIPANSGLAAFLRRPFGVPIEGLAVAAAALIVVVGSLTFEKGASKALPDTKFEAPAAAPAAAPPAAPAAEAAPPVAKDEPRQIDIQGLKYQDQRFGKGVTQADLGVGSGVSAVEGTAGASADDFAPPPAPKPAATAAPAPSAPSGSAASDLQATPTPWRYVLTAGEPTVLADLQLIAGKSGGRLVDGAGNAVRDGSTGGGTYFLVVPSGQLGAVNAGLSKLGAQLSGAIDASLYPSGWVAIQVDVMLFDRAKSRPSTSAPSKKGG